jgi:type II secretory pathway component PulJ
MNRPETTNLFETSRQLLDAIKQAIRLTRRDITPASPTKRIKTKPEDSAREWGQRTEAQDNKNWQWKMRRDRKMRGEEERM